MITGVDRLVLAFGIAIVIGRIDMDLRATDMNGMVTGC